MPVYWIWFAQLKGISQHDKQKLLETFADPEELYRAPARALPEELAEALQDKDLTQATKICQQCSRLNIGILPYTDSAYPLKLRNIEDPPLVLYFSGQLPQWQAQPFIGVVGTRKASPYGRHSTRLLVSQIVACGGLVISGGAGGIDTFALEAAQEAGKPTVVVLGSGVDVLYPAANRELFRRIRENGCLISEYPPGSPAYPGNFLRRNRIISGISEGVLVVEAPARSGALNTAGHAFSQGRDLFAVPGNLGVESSAGSNQLLQEGAYPALSGWDVMKQYETLYPGVVENRRPPTAPPERTAYYNVAQPQAKPEQTQTQTEESAKKAIDNGNKSTYSVFNKPMPNLSDREAAVFALLTDTPQLPDAIMDAATLPSGTVQSILTRLVIKGLAAQLPDGRIRRK